ncbi:MAG: 1,4-dihydroxy-2-naphthoate octaprenyltransferase [Alistipes sp.]|nr:1,4-dihydroxy-2-naphthoate octaprenyltransferase [Candidatus Minthomonas equi]
MGKIKSFLSATRPRTLPASIAPVLLGSAVAVREGEFKLCAALLCMGVALFAQIASNFANDYFDFKNGSDTPGRQGPVRMSASGKLKAETVLYGAIGFLIAACLCGLCLLFFAPWWIIPVGIVIAICVFAYSAGPYPLSRHALGDITVLVFYGLVPVILTCFVQSGNISFETVLLGTATGLLSVNILIVNNYRDVEEDKACGKITTAVLWGRPTVAKIYLVDILAACIILSCISPSLPAMAVSITLMIWGIALWRRLQHTTGCALNRLLGTTAATVSIWALAASAIIIFS